MPSASKGRESKSKDKSRHAQDLQSHLRISLSQEARGRETRHTEDHSQQSLHPFHLPVSFVTVGLDNIEEIPRASQAIRHASPASSLTSPQECGTVFVPSSYEISNGSVQDSLHKRQHGDGSDRAPQKGLVNMTTNDVRGGEQFAVKASQVSPNFSHIPAEDLQGNQISNPAFFIDSIGSEKPISTGFPTPTVRHSMSSTNSESDDEVIIFTGRSRKTTRGQSPEVGARLPKLKVDKHMTISSHAPPMEQSLVGKARNYELSAILQDNEKSQAKHKPHSAGNSWSSKRAEEDAILADYISNTRENDGNDLTNFAQLKQREVGLDLCNGEAEGFVDAKDTDEISGDEDDWNSIDLQDFDGFSTSSEPMYAPLRILRKRSRSSMTGYLVVAEGASTDKARWLPRDLLRAPVAAELIDLFEQKQAKIERSVGLDDETDDKSALEAQNALDLYGNLEATEDEKDLDERRKARMSDEQLARLLSTQAELGIVGDDLVLFNGDEEDADTSDDVSANGAAMIARYSLKYRGKFQKRPGRAFPYASALMDALERDPYDGFDIMDQNRPSLRPKSKKGRRSETMLDLSDSDLQRSMIAAWETDRAKKKHRKQDREALRAQGLLGKKGKPDLKVKSSKGMIMEDIPKEIKEFLESPARSRPIPPMGKKERKNVHEMAHKVGLKSKSVGSGVARFPVLYKTSRTKSLTPDLAAQIDAMFNPRKFLPRLARAQRRGIPASRDGREGMTATASYRDGEVVGIGAPELGLENKGRAMLEKMGWSMGTSLGAFNNKGIAQPIEQVVKTSKAGLG